MHDESCRHVGIGIIRTLAEVSQLAQIPKQEKRKVTTEEIR